MFLRRLIHSQTLGFILLQACRHLKESQVTAHASTELGDAGRACGSGRARGAGMARSACIATSARRPRLQPEKAGGGRCERWRRECSIAMNPMYQQASLLICHPHAPTIRGLLRSVQQSVRGRRSLRRSFGRIHLVLQVVWLASSPPLSGATIGAESD